MPDRKKLWGRIVLGAVLIVPVIVFFVLQAFIGATRSGTVEEVWFVRSEGGPRLVARDQIAVGSERSVKIRHRLALVDLSSGERVARRKVDAALELVRADPSGLWFRRKGDGGDLHLRSAQTLERIDARGAAPPAAPPRAAEPDAPTLREVTLPGGARVALDAARYPDGSFVTGDRTAAPLLFTDPPSALAVWREGDRLDVARVSAQGAEVWRAALENQRSVRTAAKVGEVVVLITSGAARDFAISLDAHTGATKWVHHF